MGARGVDRDREAGGEGRLDAEGPRHEGGRGIDAEVESGGVVRGLRWSLRRWGCFAVSHTRPQSLCFGDQQVAEHGADGVAGADAAVEGEHLAAAGNGHPHGGLLGFHLHDVLIRGDPVSRGDIHSQEGGLGDGFAELRHEDGNAHEKPVGVLWGEPWGNWQAAPVLQGVRGGIYQGAAAFSERMELEGNPVALVGLAATFLAWGTKP